MSVIPGREDEVPAAVAVVRAGQAHVDDPPLVQVIGRAPPVPPYATLTGPTSARIILNIRPDRNIRSCREGAETV